MPYKKIDPQNILPIRSKLAQVEQNSYQQRSDLRIKKTEDIDDGKNQKRKKAPQKSNDFVASDCEKR